jgi:hypothetical protein
LVVDLVSADHVRQVTIRSADQILWLDRRYVA